MLKNDQKRSKLSKPIKTDQRRQKVSKIEQTLKKGRKILKNRHNKTRGFRRSSTPTHKTFQIDGRVHTYARLDVFIRPLANPRILRQIH